MCPLCTAAAAVNPFFADFHAILINQYSRFSAHCQYFLKSFYRRTKLMRPVRPGDFSQSRRFFPVQLRRRTAQLAVQWHCPQLRRHNTGSFPLLPPDRKCQSRLRTVPMHTCESSRKTVQNSSGTRCGHQLRRWRRHSTGSQLLLKRSSESGPRLPVLPG